MKYPPRKKLRLPDYDYSQSGAYFITVCTKDKQCLLSTIVGADAYIGPQVRLTKIGKIAEKFLRSIPGIGEYVIMPNHIHMMLYISAPNATDGPMWASAPTGANVSKLVRSWKTLVSKEVGCSIWQRSYYDHIIRDEQDLILRLQYIAQNPAKWYDDDYYTD